MARFYGVGRWNPTHIILQIVCVQSSHYIAQGILLFVCHGTSLSLDDFFASYAQTLSNVQGVKNCFALLGSAIFSAIALCIFVERAKKCLDFAITLYFIDLIAQSFYSKFPTTWEWWIVHFVAVLLTVFLGEYLCSRRELEEIPMLSLFK